MNKVKRLTLIASILALCPALSACSNGSRVADIGIRDARLSPCPTSPNCVSSDDRDPEHQIAPFVLEGTTVEAWTTAHSLISALPGTEIVTETPDYLHAECRSAVFGFIDDLELHLRPGEGIIAIRSAARSGKYDFGVNRKRIEELRSALQKRGVVR